jgi:hypothetical protein
MDEFRAADAAMTRSRLATRTMLAAVVLVAAACTAPASRAPTSAAPTQPPRTEAPSTPEHPAPPELVGRWAAEISEDDVIRLELTDRGFEIYRFGSASGRIEVFGDEIVFSHSSLCSGEGRYRWSVEGQTLLFASIEPDVCDGRSKSLDDIEFTREPA